jgi:hypothetical protein
MMKRGLKLGFYIPFLKIGIYSYFDLRHLSRELINDRKDFKLIEIKKMV